MKGMSGSDDGTVPASGDWRQRYVRSHLYKYYVISAGILLVVVVISILLGMAHRQDALIQQQVYEKADALFEGIVLMRQWNADNGGVYVLKKPGMVSNPYLDNPDITATDGKVYTLKNPALMTREISEYAEQGDHFRFHITSLNLKNPDNAPDPWERRALRSFEDGVPEVSETVVEDGHHYYRLMKPLFVTDSCMKCHAEQGYSVGEVRGGISVTLPFDDAYDALNANFYLMLSIAVSLVAIFALVLYIFVWRLMRQFAEQKLMLERLNEAKDRFLRIAAHDLRNPLVVVCGYADLLKEMTSDEKNRDLISQIRINADRMVTLINNLLDVSKIQKGTMSLRKTEVDAAAFIEESRQHNQRLGEMKGVRLETVLPEEGTRASLDKEHMHQVLDNLIGNAFKFSLPGSTVTLGAKAEPPWLRVWVSDNGVGIPPEDLPNIFDEFTRAGSIPTGGESGTGLGLAIVRSIVELHGGRVEVESEVGAGTTFTVLIPLS